MNKKIKNEIIQFLIQRDGFQCMFPDCILPFTKEDPPTIDHWNPLSIFGDNSLDNLRLMHFKCNNRKGNIIPNADGTLNITRRCKSIKRTRPVLCSLCMSGRILVKGELCPGCGSGPQPPVFHTSMKRKPAQCPHAGEYWCMHCCIGIIPRKDLVDGC